jgi:hypothetical protein
MDKNDKCQSQTTPAGTTCLPMKLNNCRNVDTPHKKRSLVCLNNLHHLNGRDRTQTVSFGHGDDGRIHDAGA